MTRRSCPLAGDHVKHNPYFRDFPFNVPATLEFWAELTERALAVGIVPGSGRYVEIGGGELVEAGSLLSLPGYGTVQHTYEDMLAACEVLAGSAGDRVTVLHKGGPPGAEEQALYLELAGSRSPTQATSPTLRTGDGVHLVRPAPHVDACRDPRLIGIVAAVEAMGRLPSHSNWYWWSRVRLPPSRRKPGRSSAVERQP